MKQRIHPDYHPVVFRDRAANLAFLTRSTATSERTITWEDGRTYPVVDVEISSATGCGEPAVLTPIRACSKPRPSGFVTPTTWRMSSSQRRAYLARTVASETPSRAAIERNDSRPFAWSASTIPWSRASIRRGVLTGPRRPSRAACSG